MNYYNSDPFSSSNNPYITGSSGGGGGGFLSNNQVDSNARGGGGGGGGFGGEARRTNQALLPLTVRQIYTAEYHDEKFKIDKHDVNQVTIVGQVINVEVLNTNIVYIISDGSSEITVRLYTHEAENQTTAQSIRINTYVRVVGNLRMINDQRLIIAFQVIPIVDHNELTFHALDAIYTHLKQTKGSSINPSAKKPTSTSNSHPMDTFSQPAAPSFSNMQINDIGSDLPEPHKQIFNAFRSSTSQAGMSIGEVAALLHTDIGQLKAIVAWMSEEGMLYSTIDDEHYKATN